MSDEERAIRRKLAELYDEDADIEAWLLSPQSQLGWKRPIELIDAGEGARVLAMLEEVLGGSYL